MVDGPFRNAHLSMGVGVLALYSLVLSLVAGDFGFDGDDWWVFSLPYWTGYGEALIGYARDFLRPVEGAYWITLFKIFGFNSTVFHLCSLLLLVGAAGVAGWCLSRAYPERRELVFWTTLFAFFLPTVSSLTYVIFTDNSRLSSIFFWASALLFVRWAERSQSWKGLLPGVILYVLSFLTYESPSFLIFAIPVLVWPVRHRCPVRLSDAPFALRIGVGVCGGFAVAVALRFLLLSGGAVGHAGFLPPFELIWSYVALVGSYLVAPLWSISLEPDTLGLAALVGVGAALSLLCLRSGNQAPREEKGAPMPAGASIAHPIFLGLLIFFLGMIPYQLAGYGAVRPTILDTVLTRWGVLPGGSEDWFNFCEASRIYSSASFGIAICLAALVTLWTNATARRVARAVALTALFLMALFHAGLSDDWKEASEIRNNLLRNLVASVPEVRAGTNFVFLDMECYHKRAAVMRGWAGLRSLVRMIYNDPTLNAWYVCTTRKHRGGAPVQQGYVFPNGFVSRGMKMNQPAPHHSLLVMKRSGDSLVLLDRVTSSDSLVRMGIVWQGCHVLASNRDRIMQRFRVAMSPGGVPRESWEHEVLGTVGDMVPETGQEQETQSQE